MFFKMGLWIGIPLYLSEKVWYCPAEQCPPVPLKREVVLCQMEIYKICICGFSRGEKKNQFRGFLEKRRGREDNRGSLEVNGGRGVNNERNVESGG